MEVFHLCRMAVLCLTPLLLMSCRGPAGPGPVPAVETGTAVIPGVRLTARSLPWQGAWPIATQILPVRVRWENRSSVPLMIRYRDLTLVDTDGRPINALSIFPIEAEAAAPCPRRAAQAFPRRLSAHRPSEVRVQALPGRSLSQAALSHPSGLRGRLSL